MFHAGQNKRGQDASHDKEASSGLHRGTKALSLFLSILAVGTVHAQDYAFNTVAGAFVGDGLPAPSANIAQPVGIAFDSDGNLYVAESSRHRIRKISVSGVISTVAGTGFAGASGGARHAQHATMNTPKGVVVDASDNVYFADSENHVVRKISSAGLITTVAGNGETTSGGDGGAATSAGVVRPYGLAMDAAGNLYISERTRHRVRKVSPAGVITTVAGNGNPGFSGDGGIATAASLQEPVGLTIDAGGNLYISDSRNFRIRKVAPNGIISTVAGNGSFSGGDGGPATSAGIGFPYSVAVNTVGNLYIGDGNCSLREVVPSGTISTIAGAEGLCVYSGDGGLARDANLDFVEGIAVAANGDLYFADSGTDHIRKISGGVISTAAGVGSFRGDGGPAVDAIFSSTFGVGVDGSGNVYIADSYPNHRIRKISPGGTVSTVAGTGHFESSGDGGLAINAGLSYPRHAAADAAGNVYIADWIGNRIRKVAPNGVITTVAGDGQTGFGGDGGLATNARINRPSRVAVDGSGNLYIADTSNHRIRKVAPNGIITTVAGNGSQAFSGDGGPATNASLATPQGIALDANGNLYIADTGHARVRMVTPAGVISTVAGNGAFGTTGDGGPATSAAINSPTGIAIGANGDLFIAAGNLRRVAQDGTISTVQGLRHAAYDVAIDGNGAVYIAVQGGRILKGEPLPALPRRSPAPKDHSRK